MKSLFVKSNTLEKLVKNAAIHTSPSSLIEKTELIDTNELITPFELYRRYISGGDKIEFLAIKVRITLQLQLEKEIQTKFELDEFLKESINLSPDEILEYDLSIKPIIDRIVFAKYPYIQDGFISAIFPHPLDNFYIHAENKLITPTLLVTSCIIKYVYYITRVDVSQLKASLLTKKGSNQSKSKFWYSDKNPRLLTILHKEPMGENSYLTLVFGISDNNPILVYVPEYNAQRFPLGSTVYYIPDRMVSDIGELVPQEIYEEQYMVLDSDEEDVLAPHDSEYLSPQSDQPISLPQSPKRKKRTRKTRRPSTNDNNSLRIEDLLEQQQISNEIQTPVVLLPPPESDTQNDED